jgi:hypothetical protein
MNARSLKCAIGAGLVLGMQAAAPAQPGSGLIKITHAYPPYRDGFQCVPAMVAKAQPVVNRTKAPEVQVAVLGILSEQPAASRSVYIHR